MFKIKRGILLLFEGINRCGKSSHIKKLVKKLEVMGLRVKVTAEPYFDCEPGRQARQLIDSGDPVDPMELQRLMVQARACHMEKVEQWLLEYDVVISDRGMLSTVAFGAATAGEEYWDELVKWNREFRNPDLILILDVPALEAMSRGQDEETRFEKEGDVFLEGVRQYYLRIASEKIWSNIQVMDNCEPYSFDTVAGWILEAVDGVLAKKVA